MRSTLRYDYKLESESIILEFQCLNYQVKQHLRVIYQLSQTSNTPFIDSQSVVSQMSTMLIMPPKPGIKTQVNQICRDRDSEFAGHRTTYLFHNSVLDVSNNKELYLESQVRKFVF
jgi:hypothetical protein